MSQVGPIGVSPRWSTPPPCWSSGTRFPFTIVVPVTLAPNGSTCAISWAYNGAAKLTATTSRNSTSPAIATRSRRSRRQARAHGLRPVISEGRSGASSSGARAASPNAIAISGLLEPLLVDQDVPLGIPLVPLHALGEDVDLLRVVHVHPGRLVGDLMVDLRPQVVGGGRVRAAHGFRPGHLRLDRRVTELGDVRD